MILHINGLNLKKKKMIQKSKFEMCTVSANHINTKNRIFMVIVTIISQTDNTSTQRSHSYNTSKFIQKQISKSMTKMLPVLHSMLKIVKIFDFVSPAVLLILELFYLI